MGGISVNLLLLAFLIDVSEDIIENEVTGGLLSEDEGLDEFLKLSRVIGCFTDDLDDDVVKGSLGVDIGDTDFAVLEVKFTDTFLDSLLMLDTSSMNANFMTYTSSDGNWGYFGFKTRNKLGALSIEELVCVSNHLEHRGFADLHEASLATCSRWCSTVRQSTIQPHPWTDRRCPTRFQ